MFKSPKSGIVKGKAIDKPRAVNYGGIVGRVVINDKPVYWLAIAGKTGKIKHVAVTKKVYDAHTIGESWSAE